MAAGFPGCKSWCRDHYSSDSFQTCYHSALGNEDTAILIAQTWSVYLPANHWKPPKISICRGAGALLTLTQPEQVRALAGLIRGMGDDRLVELLDAAAGRFEEIVVGESART